MDDRTRNRLLSEVAGYYSSKIAEYGEQPKGVDWNGEESQVLRFVQLCRIIDKRDDFSINDLGCGYGALYDFLSARYKSFHYTGCDISKAMIAASKQRHSGKVGARFVLAAAPPDGADYTVASGIFNVRLQWNDAQWGDYLRHMLNVLDRSCCRGFAFNCLTSYSDAEKMRDDLYYADPCMVFDVCKRHYSRNVALLHDYGLYEFTILVRK